MGRAAKVGIAGTGGTRKQTTSRGRNVLREIFFSDHFLDVEIFQPPCYTKGDIQLEDSVGDMTQTSALDPKHLSMIEVNYHHNSYFA